MFLRTKIIVLDKKDYSLGIPAKDSVQCIEQDHVIHKSWMQNCYLYCVPYSDYYTFFDSKTNTLLGTCSLPDETLSITLAGETMQLGYRPVLLPLTRTGYFDQALEGRSDVPFAQGGALYRKGKPVHKTELPVPFEEMLALGDTKGCGSVLPWTIHNGFLISNHVVFTGTLRQILSFVCVEGPR